MRQSTQTVLAVSATAFVSAATILVGLATESTGHPAFQAAHSAATLAVPQAVPVRLAPQSSAPVDRTFGMKPGDCPSEDSCAPVGSGLDYHDGQWWVVVTPVVR
jgi:hypothetical protein